MFGAGTASAVAAFYTALGYPVPTAPASAGTGGKKAAATPMVPLAEIMFVPRFPARVVKVAGPVGQEASGSLVTLSMGDPAVAGQLPPSDAGLVKPGMTVTIADQATGLTRRGSVQSVGHRTKTTGSISGGVYLPMRIVPGQPLPASMIGHSVSLTITAAHSAGPVLADGRGRGLRPPRRRLYITVVRQGSDIQVPVRVGETGNGMVGIRPGGRRGPGPGRPGGGRHELHPELPVTPVIRMSRTLGYTYPGPPPVRALQPLTWSSSGASTWPSWARRARASRRC